MGKCQELFPHSICTSHFSFGSLYFPASTLAARWNRAPVPELMKMRGSRVQRVLSTSRFKRNHMVDCKWYSCRQHRSFGCYFHAVNPASPWSPGQLEKMKVEARKNAKANFTWSKSSAEAIQFYKDVLQYFEKHQWDVVDPWTKIHVGEKLTWWDGLEAGLAGSPFWLFLGLFLQKAPEIQVPSQQLLLLEALKRQLGLATSLHNLMYSNLELAIRMHFGKVGKLIVLRIEHHLSVPKPNLL